MADLTAPLMLFNSPLETGVRTVVFLDSAFPRAFDVLHLTWIDHLVVHTADIGGPPSLHPDIPQRTGELLVRRRLVEQGIELMRRQHLIDADISAEGVSYLASDSASAFVESLRSSYGRLLIERSKWLAMFLDQTSEKELSQLINDRIGRWVVEFQGPELQLGTLL